MKRTENSDSIPKKDSNRNIELIDKYNEVLDELKIIEEQNRNSCDHFEIADRFLFNMIVALILFVFPPSIGYISAVAYGIFFTMKCVYNPNALKSKIRSIEFIIWTSLLTYLKSTFSCFIYIPYYLVTIMIAIANDNGDLRFFRVVIYSIIHILSFLGLVLCSRWCTFVSIHMFQVLALLYPILLGLLSIEEIRGEFTLSNAKYLIFKLNNIKNKMENSESLDSTDTDINRYTPKMNRLKHFLIYVYPCATFLMVLLIYKFNQNDMNVYKNLGITRS